MLYIQLLMLTIWVTYIQSTVKLPLPLVCYRGGMQTEKCTRPNKCPPCWAIDDNGRASCYEYDAPISNKKCKPNFGEDVTQHMNVFDDNNKPSGDNVDDDKDKPKPTPTNKDNPVQNESKGDSPTHSLEEVVINGTTLKAYYNGFSTNDKGSTRKIFVVQVTSTVSEATINNLFYCLYFNSFAWFWFLN